MTEDAGTTWIALIGAASLHIAVGLALLSAAASGVPQPGKADAGSRKTIAVNIVPLDQPGSLDSKAQAPDGHQGGEGEKQPLHRERRGGSAPAMPPLTAATGTANGAAPAGAAAPSSADLPSAEALAYRTRLQSHLARYRIYPPAAQGAGQQGIVMLHFVVGRDGRVIDIWVEASSGTSLIDNEAVAAVMRAQPLPAFPGGWPDRLSVSLPVTFRLG
jgi:periplasmic protein TonB